MKLFMLKYNYPKMALLPHQLQQRRSLMHQGLFFSFFFQAHSYKLYKWEANGDCQRGPIPPSALGGAAQIQSVMQRLQPHNDTAESERPCLDCVLSTCLYNDWYEEICFYNTHTKHTLEQKLIYGK